MSESKEVCTKCEKLHAPTQPECYCCENCGGQVKQVPDDIYPIFECKDCQAKFFWD